MTGLILVALVVSGALLAAALWLRRSLVRERARSRALREALEARSWEEQVRGVDRLEATVRELRERGHEVNNVLSTALLSTELFFEASRQAESSPARHAELVGAAEGMVRSLQRMKLLIDESRRTETTTAPASRLIQPVDLQETVRACADRARAEFSRVEVVLREPEPEPDAHSPRLRVAVCAGVPGLTRALAAVLASACEGDGVRRPRRVELRIDARREVDVVALEISDDGPGFTQVELGRPITGFETSDPGARGLGLYTAERIARASGGSLRRGNLEGGGALVSLYLPLATEPVRVQ